MTIYLFHVNDWKYFEFTDGSIIGRTHGDLVYANDGNMSGKHARIHIKDVEGEKKVFVEDLSSKNGTLIDRGQIPAEKMIQIKLNSLLEVGSQRFILTERTDLKIEYVNTILNSNEERHAVKLVDSKAFMEKYRQDAIQTVEKIESESKETRQQIKIIDDEIAVLKEKVFKFEIARKEENLKSARAKVEISRNFEKQKNEAFAKVDQEMEEKIALAQTQIQPTSNKIQELELKRSDLDNKARTLQKDAEIRRKKREKLDRGTKV